MGSSEKFCLRWNDFEANISSAFREIRGDKEFFDVTLSCDERQVQAHKVILSACSPFFRTVLKRNPHQHPLLYLRGIKFADLEAVLEFMYHGEVNVSQDDLNSFLAVAEDLRVKGLTQSKTEASGGGGGGGEGEQVKPKSEPSAAASSSSAAPKLVRKAPPALSDGVEAGGGGGPPALKKARPAAGSSGVSTPASGSRDNSRQVGGQEDDDIEDITPVKSEPSASSSGAAGAGTMVVEPEVSYDDGGAIGDDESYGAEDDSYDYAGYSGADGDYGGGGGGDLGDMAVPGPSGADGNKGCPVEAEVCGLISRTFAADGSPSWFCLACGKTSTRVDNLKNHVEARHIHSDRRYRCPHCASEHRTKNSFHVHLSTKHTHLPKVPIKSCIIY